MRVSVVHTTRLEYTGDVIEGVTEARLGPRSDADQYWLEFNLRASPGAWISTHTDGFGNSTHLITLAAPHRQLEIIARSAVETLLDDPFRVPVNPIPPLTTAEYTDFVMPSSLVVANAELDFLARQFGPCAPERTFEMVQAMMDYVHRELEYAPQVTTVVTTVAEVLAHRRGVCQDFAHVLIGLCRAADVPARYVSGYLVTDPRVQRSRGTEASHAWVEVFAPMHGWRGFDPTNNVVASNHHVKMAVGRDYGDVAPTKGTYRGGATETLTVQVETQIIER